MRGLKLVLVFSVLLLSCNFLYSQSKKLKKIESIFDAGEYYKAAEKYKKLYGKTKTKSGKAELAFKLGECYRKMNVPRKAEKWYNRAIRYRYQDPMAVCYLADAMKMNEKYADAKITYEKFKELVPEDERADNGIESCELALKWLDNPDRYIVENMKSLNSKKSDFKPEFFKDNSIIYFTSSRESSTGDKFNNNSGQYFSDIFFSMKDRKGKWSEPVPANGSINTIYDEGASSINIDGSDMYYTSCRIIKNEAVGCKIYYSNYSGSGWSQPEVVPLIADSSVSVGQPAISPDELTLYFVTDWKGGEGGKDIWKATRSSRGQSWGQPQNLGKLVNTPGDEMFPYVSQEGTLYFSSNGHIGLGGLDIFKLVKNDDGKFVVVNLKSPINSPADDFGIVIDGKKDRGYFSSTRKDGLGNDDIYSFRLPELVFRLKGHVRNETTDDLIAGADVKLEGSDGTQLEVKTTVDGRFKFNVKPETDYILTTTKQGFLKGKASESTKGLTKSTDVEVEIFMAPTDVAIEVQNIFYDFGQAKLRPESMVALDKLVATLNFNPNITIELSAHTDFRGSDASNMDLSQRRAQSVVDYLIKKGIKAERLTPKGYGESQPRKISKKVAAKHSFLKENDVLTEEFINALTNKEDKETAHQINRRTEFKVLQTKYDETGTPFGEEN